MTTKKILSNGVAANASLFDKTLQIAKTLNASCRLCLQNQQQQQQEKQKFTSIFQQKDQHSPTYSTLAMSFAKLNVRNVSIIPAIFLMFIF